jgi:hypothetical protein
MTRYFALITLLAVGLRPCAWGQSYTPLFSPSSNINLTAYCLTATGQYIPYAEYAFETYYWTNTNAHFHDDPNHVYSSVSPTNAYDDTGSGYVNLTLSTSIIGQAEGIAVWCWNDNGEVYSEYDHAVGYSNIYWNYHPEIWVQTGGNTTNHGDNSYNHWMTTNAAYGIYYTSYQYLQNHPEQGYFGQNDEGLPFGGKFDIKDNWQSPHITHDWGTAADIRGNTAMYAVPNQYQQEFINDCQNFQAIETIIEYVGTPAQHIHCRWAF